MNIRALLTLILLALSFSVSATLVLKENVQFDRNNWRLSIDQRQVLTDFINQSAGYIVEKIDIEGHCDRSGSDFFNLELSKKRALSVYDVLVEQFPDDGDYELRFVGEQHPLSLFEDDPNRCVMITMYLLETDIEVVGGPIERVLFPEEFPLEVVNEEVDEVDDKPAPPVSSFIPENFREAGQFSIENIHFHGNSSVVKSDSDDSLKELAEFLLYYEDVDIRLEGHVNGKMGKSYLKKAARSNPERRVYKNGKELSLARAETVKDYLMSEGVDGGRIECIGKGGTEMLYKKPKTQKENAANRRIEVIVLNN